MRIFLDEQPRLEDELKQAYRTVARKGVSLNPSAAELAGYAIYLLSDPEVGTNIPLSDSVAYVADSLNVNETRMRRTVAEQLVLLASSPDALELEELLVGYSSSRTPFGPGRTVALNGPHPGDDTGGKVWRNEWYAGGGDDPSTGDKTYEHDPLRTRRDQQF